VWVGVGVGVGEEGIVYVGIVYIRNTSLWRQLSSECRL
jgi:hypothetical protein